MPSLPGADDGHLVASIEPSLIEIGWVLVGRLDETDRDAIYQARNCLLDSLRDTFPDFTWRMPIVQREELGQHYHAEPAVLLDYGMTEREVKHWDFAVILTDADLVSHYKPYALGAVSRSVSVAMISTARLDPQSTRSTAPTGERLVVMRRRICALVQHLFGHLNGLVHHDDTGCYMYNVERVEDLDRMDSFCPRQVEQLRANLHEVADVRLEEEEPSVRGRAFWFYLRGMWRGRADIVRAILHARPWEFPFRLSRLTTAAVSVLLILLMTAEAWDLGMSQSVGLVVGLSCTALVITSAYILRRQQLLMRRDVSILSEQSVITNSAITMVVLLGMLTTYSGLFFAALGLSTWLFSHQLVVGWAASLNGEIHTVHYVVLAAFVASLGLLIGALGASFEQHYYFRHVTYIDEET